MPAADVFEAALLVFMGLLVALVWLHVRGSRQQPFGYLYHIKGRRLARLAMTVER